MHFEFDPYSDDGDKELNKVIHYWNEESLLKYIVDEGTVDVNEVMKYVEQYDNEKRNIYPFFYALSGKGFIKLTDETHFKATLKGKLYLIYKSPAWIFWLLLISVVIALLSLLSSLWLMSKS